MLTALLCFSQAQNALQGHYTTYRKEIKDEVTTQATCLKSAQRTQYIMKKMKTHTQYNYIYMIK